MVFFFKSICKKSPISKFVGKSLTLDLLLISNVVACSIFIDRSHVVSTLSRAECFQYYFFSGKTLKLEKYLYVITFEETFVCPLVTTKQATTDCCMFSYAAVMEQKKLLAAVQQVKCSFCF